MIESTAPIPATAPATASRNPVERALSAGWQAFKARPWLLTLPQVILLPLACLVLPTLILAVTAAIRLADAPDATYGAVLIFGALLIGLPFLLILLLAAIFGTGYVVAALRAVRGEPTGAGDLFAGFRRAPGIALAVLITGFAAVAIVFPTALGLALVAGAGRVAPDALIGHPLAQGLAAGLVYASGAALLILAIAAAYYVFAGLSQWPFLLLDGGLGARDAVAGSWRMMRGRRLALLSLWFAASALNVVGLLLLVFGVIFTSAIGVAAFAAFHHGLEHAELTTDALPAASPRPRRTPLAAWAVDAWIALGVTALFTLAMLVGSTVWMIGFARSVWSPYAPAWILAGIAPFVIVPVAYFVIGWASGGTPGQRIVGPGWGRFRWLGVVYGLAVVVQIAPLVGIVRDVPGGILALAVGYETARQLVAALPEGFDSAPNNEGASDQLDLPKRDPYDLSISASYRITDTVGAPYRFVLRRYFHEETAVAAAARMHEAGARAEPVAGAESVATAGAAAYPAPTSEFEVETFAVDDLDAGVVRIVARSGDTVIAGEAEPENADGLRYLIGIQLARMDAAREGVDRVYRWLPVERLEED